MIFLIICVALFLIWLWFFQTTNDIEEKIIYILARYPNLSAAQISKLADISSYYLYPSLQRLEAEKKIIGEFCYHPIPARRRYRLAGGI